MKIEKKTFCNYCSIYTESTTANKCKECKKQK